MSCTDVIELLQLRVLRVDRSGIEHERASPRRAGSRIRDRDGSSVTPMTPCAGICGSRGAERACCEQQISSYDG